MAPLFEVILKHHLPFVPHNILYQETYVLPPRSNMQLSHCRDDCIEL